MSLPHISNDRYTLTIRTFPEGNLQVHFTWHADACELLLDQASLYAGRVTSFRATLAEHTADSERRILHELHWKTTTDDDDLQAVVRDSLRADLYSQLLAGLDSELHERLGLTSPVARAEWGWNYDTGGVCIDDLPDFVILADGTRIDDVNSELDSGVFALTDRFFFTELMGLSTDEDLVICRASNGAITANADPDFVDEPTLKATA
ncbi:MAG: hypothetical protein DI630_31035 [Gordonia sp. (in: high G+C Gram-positive bacteria)]|nr:MAG: hypothetical protein DI630_31035 [Gordonia sp. (in: high G+C Gram-positive bacteria)]